MMDLFMSQKTVSMTFFTDCYTQNLFFIGELMYIHSMDCFFFLDNVVVANPCLTHLEAFFKFFFLLKHPSPYTTHILL